MSLLHSLAAAALATLAAHATAQQSPRPQAADPAAPAPAAQYDSAFSSYRAYREEPLVPWRDANDEVGRIGGHIGIFRPSKQPAGAAPKAPPTRPAEGEASAPSGQAPARGTPRAAQGGHAGH